MKPASTPEPVADIGRLGRAAAWISALCCLPYFVLKIAWSFDVPLGVSDRSVLDTNGWVATNAAMAAVELAGLVLVLALTRPWAWRVPAWILLLPVWVGTGLLFQIIVGAVMWTVFSSATGSSGGTDLGGFQAWVFVLVYASFAGQGVALAIAFAAHVRARWGHLLAADTNHALAGRRSARPHSWPREHLTELALTAAGALVAVAVVESYWAAGGGFGLSDAEPHPAQALAASGVVAAVTAAAGLLAFASGWGGRAPLWLPIGLIWLGSGAVAGFDGLNLVLDQLLRLFGTDASGAGWTLTDTSLTIKVLIGVLAAAVGAVAVDAAGSAATSEAMEAPPKRPLAAVS